MSIHNPTGTGGGGGGSNTIQELDNDPALPMPEEVWVLRTVSGSIPDGTAIGMLLALTYEGNAGSSLYQLSYQTIEGPIVRVTLN